MHRPPASRCLLCVLMSSLDPSTQMCGMAGWILGRAHAPPTGDADVWHGWVDFRRAHAPPTGEPKLAERDDVELGRENDIAGHGWQDTKISNSK